MSERKPHLGIAREAMVGQRKVRIMSGQWAGLIGLVAKLGVIKDATGRDFAAVVLDVGGEVSALADDLKYAAVTLSYEEALTSIETWSVVANEAMASLAARDNRPHALVDQLQATYAERDQAIADRDAMQANWEAQTAATMAARAERDHHMKRCDEMERERRAWRDTTSPHDQKVKDLETKLANMAMTNDQLRERITVITDQRDAIDEDSNELRIDINALVKAISRDEAEIQRLRAALAKAD